VCLSGCFDQCGSGAAQYNSGAVAGSGVIGQPGNGSDVILAGSKIKANPTHTMAAESRVTAREAMERLATFIRHGESPNSPSGRRTSPTRLRQRRFTSTDVRVVTKAHTRRLPTHSRSPELFHRTATGHGSTCLQKREPTPRARSIRCDNRVATAMPTKKPLLIVAVLIGLPAWRIAQAQVHIEIKPYETTLSMGEPVNIQLTAKNNTRPSFSTWASIVRVH